MYASDTIIACVRRFRSLKKVELQTVHKKKRTITIKVSNGNSAEYLACFIIYYCIHYIFLSLTLIQFKKEDFKQIAESNLMRLLEKV